MAIALGESGRSGAGVSRFGGGVVPKGVSTPDEAPESALMPGDGSPVPTVVGCVLP